MKLLKNKNKKYQYELLIGCNDKDTYRQEITDNLFKKYIDLTLYSYNIDCYTLQSQFGVYNDGVTTTYEKSFDLIIILDKKLNDRILNNIIIDLKKQLNQNSIGLKKTIIKLDWK